MSRSISRFSETAVSGDFARLSFERSTCLSVLDRPMASFLGFPVGCLVVPHLSRFMGISSLKEAESGEIGTSSSNVSAESAKGDEIWGELEEFFSFFVPLRLGKAKRNDGLGLTFSCGRFMTDSASEASKDASGS